MPQATLRQLLERNQAHVDELASDHFAEVKEGQQPPVVSICCSDSRVSQEGMFAVDDPGWLFTPSSIGNQAWDLVDEDRVVDGSVLYPIHHTGTRTIAVVGHTGCGAITAAYEATQSEDERGDMAPGIAKRVALLGPVVAQALRDERVDRAADAERVVDELVEVNVHEQVAFLREAPEIPDDAEVYGFVYDLTGAYGGPAGRLYLVDADGETDQEALRAMVPKELEGHVASLLA